MNFLKPTTYSQLLIAFSLAFFPGYATESTRQKYLDLIQRCPKLVETPGNSSKGEIELILDKKEMAASEKSLGIDIGVIQESKWGWVWINEACKFPNGNQAVFGRILLSKNLQGIPGAAILPIMPNGKIALLRAFRHATRSWEIELPRGMVESGETSEEAAKRELFEETGLVTGRISFLGKIAPDTGLTGTIVDIFAVEVAHQQDPQKESTEVIDEILMLSFEEVRQALVKGYLECCIQGHKQAVPLRDPFLAYAFLLHQLRNPNEKN